MCLFGGGLRIIWAFSLLTVCSSPRAFAPIGVSRFRSGPSRIVGQIPRRNAILTLVRVSPRLQVVYACRRKRIRCYALRQGAQGACKESTPPRVGEHLNSTTRGSQQAPSRQMEEEKKKYNSQQTGNTISAYSFNRWKNISKEMFYCNATGTARTNSHPNESNASNPRKDWHLRILGLSQHTALA
ncbi:hypothetical protein BJY52DRAFT_1224507 [Lactarius psammicola]|nr:hypothetical protein BJY52DRAFT_1224507 [Lactarius psammicola]